MRPLMIGQTPECVEELWKYQEREADDERRCLRIEANEGRMKSVVNKTFKVQFLGRKIGVVDKIGAVGKCWPITMEVKAEKRTDIKDILHETYELISSLKTEEVVAADPWKLKRVVR